MASSEFSDSDRTAVLAIELDGDGAHPGAWRFAGHAPRETLSAQLLVGDAQAADIAGFHLATYRDSRSASPQDPFAQARIDAIQRAAFVAPLTRSLGLVPEAGPIYTEPFHLSTQLATLDYASQGRAGWLINAENTEVEARSVGRARLEDSQRSQEIADVVEAVRGLWDSWEDDAVIRDVATGRYLDRDKLHYVDFEGERFSLKGPSIIPRPLQGQPVIFANAQDAVAVGADVALVQGPLEELGQSAAKLRGSVPRVIVDLPVVLDSRGQSGAARLAELNASLDDTSSPETLVKGWSAKEAYIGDAAGLVELVKELLASADGVRFLPAQNAVDIQELSFKVLPALAENGAVVPPRAGATLRESFGLERPANRFVLKEELGETSRTSVTKTGSETPA